MKVNSSINATQTESRCAHTLSPSFHFHFLFFFVMYLYTSNNSQDALNTIIEYNFFLKRFFFLKNSTCCRIGIHNSKFEKVSCTRFQFRLLKVMSNGRESNLFAQNSFGAHRIGDKNACFSFSSVHHRLLA